MINGGAASRITGTDVRINSHTTALLLQCAVERRGFSVTQISRSFKDLHNNFFFISWQTARPGHRVRGNQAERFEWRPWAQRRAFAQIKIILLCVRKLVVQTPAWSHLYLHSQHCKKRNELFKCQLPFCIIIPQKVCYLTELYFHDEVLKWREI